MSLTYQPAAYEDCYRAYELAQTHRGYRIPFSTDTAARYFQLRMNQARVILRNESRRAYPRDHHLYDKSEHDGFQVTVREDEAGEFWVYIQPHGNWSALAEGEPIPHEEQELLAPTHKPHQLTLEHTRDASESDDLV